MIPKKIHYIWLSNNSLPVNTAACIQSWERYAKDYAIKRWTMSDFDFSSMPEFVREAVRKEKWAFACDYLRLYILEKEGGIYLDSDVLMLESPDRFLNHSFFSAVEYYPDLFELGKKYVDAEGCSDAEEVAGMAFQAAIMGSIPHHPFPREVMTFYQTHNFIQSDGTLYDKILAPQIYASFARKYGFRYINQYQEFSNGIVLYPSEVLAPGYQESTEESAMIHLCAASWRNDVKSDYADLLAQQIRDAVIRRSAPYEHIDLKLAKFTSKIRRKLIIVKSRLYQKTVEK